MKKSVAIIGGGPSAFLLAAFLDASKFDVTIYEKNKTAGRKFLVAGKGGFNLTHSEPIEQLIKRYSPTGFLDNVLLNFTNTDFRDWLEKILLEAVKEYTQKKALNRLKY
jgi:predicted flavoprotein YhiN